MDELRIRSAHGTPLLLSKCPSMKQLNTRTPKLRINTSLDSPKKKKPREIKALDTPSGAKGVEAPVVDVWIPLTEMKTEAGSWDPPWGRLEEEEEKENRLEEEKKEENRHEEEEEDGDENKRRDTVISTRASVMRGEIERKSRMRRLSDKIRGFLRRDRDDDIGGCGCGCS
jgi:hypothetical protein